MRTKTLVGVSLILAFLFLSIVFAWGLILNPQQVSPYTTPLWITLPKSVEENINSLNLTLVEKSGNNGNLGNVPVTVVPTPKPVPVSPPVITRAS